MFLNLNYSSEMEDDNEDASSAWSLKSTANDLLLEHGRRFPSYRPNSSPFPRGDEIAKENEKHLENLMLHLYNDHLYTAPIEQPKNVLDVRCGHLAIWAKNMADRFPDTQVTALDDFTPDAEGRPNLQFLLQNFNDEWILDEITQVYGKLDLVYVKHIFASSRDYPQFYAQCINHLEPGGYLEQTEMVPECSCDDGVFRSNSIIKALCNLVPDMEKSWGARYNIASDMKRLIEEAGFVDVQQRIDIVPWSPWLPAGTREHETGRLFQLFYETGLQGWIVRPLAKAGYSDEEINQMVEAAFIELSYNDQHWYSPCVTVTARKPLATPA